MDRLGSQAFTFATATDGFAGYTSAVPITSITFTSSGGTGGSNWAQLDHFYVGAAVPEPCTMALLTLGVAGAVGAAIKRRRSC